MDFAENWCSLLELFVSSAGLKLRMQMVDTVLIKTGRVLGHFYTSKDGYICRFSAHEITRQAVYQRLASLHSLDPQLNPFGYIAVAHYGTGVSRLLKRAELQELMATICGPYEFAEPSPLAAQNENLFCIQSYVVPRKDVRYIASYDVQEGPLCTVLARRFSSRYTHAMDDPGTLVTDPFEDTDEPPTASAIMASAAAAAAAAAASDGSPGAGGLRDDPGAPALSADELLVESQLVALGLLEPRRVKDGEATGADNGEEGGDGDPPMSPSDAVSTSMPAPRRIKDDIARLLQVLSSFVERAHGQRIVGLVAEFIAAAGPVAGAATSGGAPPAGALVLMAVHAVQLDPRASRGRLGTFTERWTDYLEGLAPAPAPQAPGRRNQSPGMLRAGDASLVMTDRSSGLLVRTAPAPTGPSDRLGMLAAAAVLGGPHRLSPAAGGGVGLGGGATAAVVLGTHSLRVHGGGGSAASSPAASTLTRIYSASPSLAAHRVAALAEAGRPGSAPAAVVKVGRHVSNSVHSSASNGHYTLRNVMSAARAGGGGNPTSAPTAPDSYNLWLSREGGPTDSMVARLALEVESLRERLQRQTDIAVRAEAALQHLALSSRRETTELRQQIEELRNEVGRLGEAKRNLAVEYDRLRSERLGLQAGRSELSGEVERLRGELAGERETLARAVRDATAREEQLEAQLRTAREEREEALKQMGGLRRRVEEESEVVEALRGQLYDYKQLVAQLQAQVRRGRNNKQLVSLQGLPTTIASSVNIPSGMTTSNAGGGDAATSSSGTRVRHTKDGEDSDAETDLVLAGGGNGGAGDQGGMGGLHSSGKAIGGTTGSSRVSNAEGGHLHTHRQSSPTPGSHHHFPARRGETPGTASVKSRRVSTAEGPRSHSPSRHGHSNSGTARSVTLSSPNPQLMSATIYGTPLELTPDAFTVVLADIRRKRLGLPAPAGPLERLDSAATTRDGPGGTAPSTSGAILVPGSISSVAASGEISPSRLAPPPSPSALSTTSPTGLCGRSSSPGSTGGASVRAGSALGARPINYEQIIAHDLFLMSWARESLTPRMIECHAIAIQLVAAEEASLAEIFNFYGHLGQVVWLDSRLTMNEKQFIKLACETGVSESSVDDMKEVFRKLSDKTEFASETAVRHPSPYINFEQFPEAVLRLAALRYEWRPPENLEDAEEELYFASPPFMPPNPREEEEEVEAPPRPPETVYVQIVKAYLKDDLVPRARRFKTAGSARAKYRSLTRTAPSGLWLSSKSLTAGVKAADMLAGV
ncbi:hypothetical protein Agub_g5806 [Astrephomene gubernaculifera]|uniref:Uncharacterized protein n=1 Tax=Astrephomene gubernaculifera TaxID=47775 RepID=A0AAD3DRE2_9CHLO|nr:hypothetical protein Agub_g5806 [Astrephomene gubernaculifera]